MNKQELMRFARNYTSDQFNQIRFDWNGKHGDAFADSNYDFRMQLCEAIKDDLSAYGDQLILDLYLELSKSSKETFGVYLSYHLFANELLERGGVKYFDQYIEGASKSMDTGMASGKLSLSKSRIEEILAHIKNTINNSDNPRKIGTYNYMLRRFEWLAKK